MIDDHNRPDQSQTTPANDEAGAEALERDDIQQAQDQAGIAGEPQPTDTEGEQEEPTSPAV